MENKEYFDEIARKFQELRKINVKYLDESFAEISELLHSTNVSITIPEINFTGEGIIEKNNKSFHIKINTRTNYRDEFKKQLQIELKSNKNIYNGVNALFIGESSDFKNSFLTYTIDLYSIIKGINTGDKYFCMILPLQRSIFISIDLPKYLFNYENLNCTGLVKTAVSNKDYDIFEITNDKEKFLFIDCMSENSLNELYDHIMAILLSIGIFTTYFIQDECFIFSSRQNNFKNIDYFEYRTLRKSIKLPFPYFDNNPFDIFDKDIAQDYIDKMPIISQNVFEKMVNSIYLDLELQSSVFVFIESSTYPLDTQPACLSVALEGICGYIMKNHKENTSPIKDKDVFKRLKIDLLDTLNKCTVDIDDEGKHILSIKIKNLNAPTNQDKLSKAFEILNIKLKEYQTKAISNRNNFLHGRVDCRVEKEINDKESFAHKMFFTSCVLSHLFIMLISKIAGYDGVLINNIKVYQHIFGEFADEEMLINIGNNGHFA
jgi:hypothetical protein